MNHKRVERLYAEARLQVKRRRRKKVPVADRQPLVRPQAPNAVWSADFVFDRTADGRVLRSAGDPDPGIWHDKPETARRVRQPDRRRDEVAVAMGYRSDNPASDALGQVRQAVGRVSSCVGRPHLFDAAVFLLALR